MNKDRAGSSPELCPSLSFVERSSNDSSIEGILASVKLLLKLIQEHNGTSVKDNDGLKMESATEMIRILDSVKSQIQKSQTSGKRRAELRRCNTELKPLNAPREKKPHEPITDEKETLRQELNSCMAARKSLESMFSSLGKEKEIIAAELARKVQELNAMEEDINDLKAQNEMLLGKVHTCATKHKERKGDKREGNETLQERNKELSEKLLKSLEGYKSLKRKLTDLQEENTRIQANTQEIMDGVMGCLNRIRDFQQQFNNGIGKAEEIEVQLSELEQMFHCFEIMLSKRVPKKRECAVAKSDIDGKRAAQVQYQRGF